MKKILGYVCLPIIALLLLFAALAEPTVGGEITWVWWIIALLGGSSFAGWLLGKFRGK